MEDGDRSGKLTVMAASRLPFTLLATAALAAVAAAPAAAAPAVSGEFPVDGTPGQLTLGPDGNVWAVLSGGGADIAKIAPDGTVTPYRDARLANAVGIVTGPDRNLWITRNGEVVRFSPADPVGTDTAFAVAGITDPRRIASDGSALWTASNDQLFRIDPATGTTTRTTVTGMGARGTAIGGDGTILIADFGGARIVSLAPSALDRPTFTAVGGNPQEVAGGSGATFAYGNPGAFPQEVGAVTPPGAALRVPTPGTDPFGITLGDDGAWWIANFASHDLTRLTTAGTVTKLGGFSAASGPRWITRGSGGTLWVSLELARRVARVSGVEAPPAPPREGGGGGGTPPPRDGGGGTTTPPPPVDRTRPQLTLTRVGRAVAGARALVVTARVDEAATVSATLRQRLLGTQRRGACVRPTRRLRRARTCVRWVVLGRASGSLTAAGSVRLTFRRRDGRQFAAGRYRVNALARDRAGNRTERTLTVVLRRRR
jgi:virginiamycin B lyase